MYKSFLYLHNELVIDNYIIYFCKYDKYFYNNVKNIDY